MQTESTNSELHEGLPLLNKYTNNKTKLFNIKTIKQKAFKLCFSTNLLGENLLTLGADRPVTKYANNYFLPKNAFFSIGNSAKLICISITIYFAYLIKYACIFI